MLRLVSGMGGSGLRRDWERKGVAILCFPHAINFLVFGFFLGALGSQKEKGNNDLKEALSLTFLFFFLAVGTDLHFVHVLVA